MWTFCVLISPQQEALYLNICYTSSIINYNSLWTEELKNESYIPSNILGNSSMSKTEQDSNILDNSFMHKIEQDRDMFWNFGKKTCSWVKLRQSINYLGFVFQQPGNALGLSLANVRWTYPNGMCVH